MSLSFARIMSSSKIMYLLSSSFGSSIKRGRVFLGSSINAYFVSLGFVSFTARYMDLSFSLGNGLSSDSIIGAKTGNSFSTKKSSI